ncbi:MAG: hypothetical protein PHZ11_04205 [Desulfitobacteriaceae bacterium]|nr:hypothetical protein [Desulfitobacteriaceae bacterium]MDD4346094.1 hypothetical protein [Desulfitobacteriaceae bacterium]MDD4400891.1 hypothetical protein [Desulfitobacteriaceae bacterium]
MQFPYGEGVIFLLTMITWAQRHPSARLFILLSLAWLIGRIVDSLIIGEVVWQINYARLAVILVFWFWARRKAEGCVLAFSLSLLSLVLMDLFLVNEPGILLFEKWISAGLCFVVARLAAATYWEMAAAVAGSMLINQGLIMFFFGGIVSYVAIPDGFLWNFGVLALTLQGLIRYVRLGGVEHFN